MRCRLLRRVCAQVPALPVVLVVTVRSTPAEIGAAAADLVARSTIDRYETFVRAARAENRDPRYTGS